MEANTDNKQKSFSWAYGIIVFSVAILLSLFCFAFYKIAILGKQLQNTVFTMQQHITILQTAAAHEHQQTQQSLEAMNQAVAELKHSLSGDKNTWRIIEAQHYVKLADAKLQYEENIPIAIQLLQAADNEIRDFNDPRLDSARKILAEDIASLQGTSLVDYTGLYMRIYALNQEINKLPMLVKPAENNAQSISVVSNEPWWKQGLQRSWEMLQKIVIVRYHASGAPPFLTPDQQAFLLQNCHAIVEKAMWAVLNKQPEIYRASLQQASAWISEYFILDAPATKSMLSNLNELQQINIHPVVPRVTASLQVFNDYLANIKN